MKRVYTKVTATGPNTFKLVSSVFTGYVNYWGEGTRKNHNIVYVPSLRLSGTYDDVRNYIVTAAGTPAVEAQFMAGTLTYANHTSTTPVQCLQFDLSAPTDSPSPFVSVSATYADIFASEVAWSEGREAKTDRSGSQLMSLTSLLTEINGYLGLLERPQVGSAGPKSKSTATKTSVASSPSDIAKKLRARVQAIKDGMSLNVSGYKRGTGNGARGIPRAVPDGGIRLNPPGSQWRDGMNLDKVYFKLVKNGAVHEVPDGAYAFLEDLGFKAAEARQVVDAARAAVPAVVSKVSLPVPSFGVPSALPVRSALPVPRSPSRAHSPPRARSPPRVPAFGAQPSWMAPSVPRSPRSAVPAFGVAPAFGGVSPRASPLGLPRSPRASPSPSGSRTPRSSPSGLPLPSLGTPK